MATVGKQMPNTERLVMTAREACSMLNTYRGSLYGPLAGGALPEVKIAEVPAKKPRGDAPIKRNHQSSG